MNESEQAQQTETPAMSYRAQLTAHRETIERIAGQYRTPNGTRVQWERALAAEAALESSLLVGPGPRKDQLDRLKGVYQYWHPNRKEITGKPTTQQINFKGQPSQCYQLDQHRDQLFEVADRYRRPDGKVWWKQAMREEPALARAIGMHEAKNEHNFLTTLTFWYRSRKATAARWSQKPAALRPAPALQTSDSSPHNGAVPAQPAAHVRFCSHCGHPVGLDVLASDVIRSMTTAGMTQDQIVNTLTRTAAAVTKLTTQDPVV